MEKRNKMKKGTLITATIFLLMISGCRREYDQQVTVVRDCTGTYLRLDGLDYQVCNPQAVASFSDAAAVIASFRKVHACNGSGGDETICDRFHQSEGWIEVAEIRSR
jgi:hypothetical protein